MYALIDDSELRKCLQAAANGNPKLAHDFFAKFDYNFYMKERQFLQAHDQAIYLMLYLMKLDEVAYNKIHKGHPFYFTAISSFLLRNYAEAVFFFDAAVSEDLKNAQGERTPAIIFLEMDGQSENQAARELTKIAEDKLNIFTDQYNCINSLSVSIPVIRKKFLSRAVSDKQEWRTMATSLISFVLESGYLADLQSIRDADGTREPFYTHLFKGCVLLESLLKVNPNMPVSEDQLGKILNKNKQIRDRLGIREKIKTVGPSLSNVLDDLPKAENSIKSDLEISTRLRNTIGHNISWTTPMTSDAYVQLVSKIMNSILHTISGLY